MPSAEERFRAKVKHRRGHDVWTGARDARGVGMVRIDGKLRTVQRAAWEFAHGPVPAGARVNTCAAERACVDVSHLSVSPTPASKPDPATRRRRGTGSLRQMSPDTWELAVSEGVSPTGAACRRFVTAHGDHAFAEATLARLVAATTRSDLGDLSVPELVNRFLHWSSEEQRNRVANREDEIWERIIDPVLGKDLAGFVTSARIESVLRATHQQVASSVDIRDALGLMRSAYKWARTRGWCRDDPTAGLELRDIL